MANGAVNTVSRVGQINGTGNTDALFLKVFSNEILTTFEEANVMKDLHTVRTISSGKEAQFPVIGSAEAKYFSVGEDVLESSAGYAQQIKHGERTISIDDMLIAATFVANIDENLESISAPVATSSMTPFHAGRLSQGVQQSRTKN